MLAASGHGYFIIIILGITSETTRPTDRETGGQIRCC